uniref:Uncharacterized protein n=3 Tax=Oryza TaxID=4527 RepID=A0A0E0PFS4_ORYRU
MSMASIIILAVVFVLDVLAFVLAIGAEKRRNTAAYVNVDQNARPYCVYGSDAATGYGIGALVLLAAGQAVIMVATRCFCCGRALSPGRWRAFAGFCFITCCTLVISGPPRCAMLRKGVFAAGAAFTFLTALFAELHYLFFAKARHAAAVPPPIVGGIGMTRM